MQVKLRLDFPRILLNTNSKFPINKVLVMDVNKVRHNIIVTEEPCTELFHGSSIPCAKTFFEVVDDVDTVQSTPDLSADGNANYASSGHLTLGDKPFDNNFSEPYRASEDDNKQGVASNDFTWVIETRLGTQFVQVTVDPFFELQWLDRQDSLHSSLSLDLDVLEGRARVEPVNENGSINKLYGTSLAFPKGIDSALSNGAQGPDPSFRDPTPTNGRDDPPDARLPNGGGEVQSITTESESVDGKVSRSLNDGENGVTSRDSALVASSNGVTSRDSTLVAGSNEVEAEWTEQYEPGVYITVVALRDGTRDLKRVRFSRKRFTKQQSETWWSENRENVYEKYTVRGSDKSLVSGQAARRSKRAMSSSSQS
ncbi:hypothetical protein GH714_009584 [Hevea brasiliensis]|uniref:BRX domain-containing protein n=1 Tax=Hevea brasiliensis TaxID=3981 RepID=A0A6A6L0I5_HEVBR|nr:hypothetical protein GH714_009584 [Hevea brasiliensis]